MSVAHSVKAALRSGRPVIGTLTLMSDPWVVEIAGNAGLDFIIIDMEHAASDYSDVENLLRAAEAADIAPLIRVPELGRKSIGRVMDSGAEGVVLPLVEDAQEADALRSLMAYPPRGTRTTCSMVRASERGLFRESFRHYVERVNDESLAVALVETATGVQRIDEILRADIDVVFLGRSDLSADLGLYYDVDNPRVIEMCEDVLAKTATHDDRWVGILAYSLADAEAWLRRGCTFVVYSQPEFVLASTYRASLEHLRAFSGLGDEKPPKVVGVDSALP
jgi:4-hydroxy-2-oxoheptanedioate aldolase